MNGPVRYDRAITVGVVRPVRRIFSSGSHEDALTILMYHSVSAGSEDHVPSYYRVHTHPGVFAQHMQWLRDQKIRGVTLREGLANHTRGGTPGARQVVLTFDDGFGDFRTAAFPVLSQHGFGATVFLATAFIGNRPRLFKHKECLTWCDIRELHKGGIEFGSHTVNHPQLHDLNRSQIGAELRTSKCMIEQELGNEVYAFSYPYAFPSGDPLFVDDLSILLGEAAYGCQVTTEVGRNHPGAQPYRLKRLPVNSCDDHALFTSKLAGDYDWLGRAQVLSKQCRRWVGGRLRP